MATSSPAPDPAQYKVVVNHEEQYSIWKADSTNPPGWFDAGYAGTKDECLDHIETVWTDITPLSVRRALREAATGETA